VFAIALLFQFAGVTLFLFCSYHKPGNSSLMKQSLMAAYYIRTRI